MDVNEKHRTILLDALWFFILGAAIVWVAIHYA